MTRKLQIGSRIGTAVVIVGLALAGVHAYLSYRNRTLDRLYREASGLAPLRQGSRKSRAAVQKLATYSGQRSTALLLELALQDNPLAPEVRAEAFKALRQRKDPKVAEVLAGLLQPFEGLDTRQAAASALRDLPCDYNCVQSVLHYLERIWWGDKNYEDTFAEPPGLENARAKLLRDQRQVYSDLDFVLERKTTPTMRVLLQIYGLGSQTPSRFALDLVTRLHLHQACPALDQSEKLINTYPAGTYQGPGKQLQAAISSLGCK